jgi:tetratricopeptide (TPR) repeat protein
LIKPKLDATSPLSYFEKYTYRAELQINNGDFKHALSALQEISSVINAAGFTEEYLRVGSILFDSIDWLKAITEEYTYFNDQFVFFARTLVEKGKFEEVERYLQKYIDVIPGKSVSYLAYCNIMSYYYWFRDDQTLAIEWAEKGLDLTRQTGVVSGLDNEHNLALALRDTREDQNIEKALNLFLKGEKLENVLSGEIESDHFSSSYFGNIGRCLWFQRKKDEALICYFKSFDLLQKEKNANTFMNLGYASLWIFEVLFDKKMYNESLQFLRYCLMKWESYAPFKAMNVRLQHNDFLEKPQSVEFLSTLSVWDIETFCKKYVEKSVQKKEPVL